MNPEQLEKTIVDTLEKSVPEAAQSAAKEAVAVQIAEFKDTQAKEMEAIKAELKKASLATKQNDEGVKQAFVKTAMVSIVKDVVHNDVKTEKAFQDTVENVIKTMNEGTATEGAELVFDQFERDVLRVINDYTLVGSVKMLNLAKGDKVNLPKGTNSITTAYVGEAGTPTASDATTAYITLDIYKAVTLVDMTDELLDDTMTIPDLYDLIVEFIGESQAEFLEDEILNGTGTNAIEGILVNSDVNVVTMEAGDTTSAALGDSYLVETLTKAAKKFKRNKSQIAWVMSQYVYGKILALKTSDGYPLYPELRDFANPSLMGYKVIISDKAPVQDDTEDVAGATLLLFGDLKYFTLARRKGLTLERGYYGNNWRDGVQSLKGTSRMGGKCTFGEALTKLVTAGA